MAKHANWVSAAEAMAAAAGNGLGELKSNMGALGKSCKSCHSEYKAR